MKCENMVFTRHNFFYKYISLSSVLSSEKEKKLHKKTVEETEFLSFFYMENNNSMKLRIKVNIMRNLSVNPFLMQ